MRILGSYFHIAMNGMAASDKIFRLLDLPEPDRKSTPVPEVCTIECKQLHFGYEADREILHGVTMAASPPSWANPAAENPPWRLF